MFTLDNLSPMLLRNGLIINGASLGCYALVWLTLRRQDGHHQTSDWIGALSSTIAPSFDRPRGLQTSAPLQITGGHHDSGGWLLLCRVCHQIGVRIGGKPLLPTPHPSLHFRSSHLHGGHQQSTVAFCFQANSFRQIPMISPHILATNIAALFAPNSNNGQ